MLGAMRADRDAAAAPPPTWPGLRWTAAEAPLLAELARRALVARAAGGAAARAPELAVAVVAAGAAGEIALEVRYAAAGAGAALTLALEPVVVAGHRWRATWALVVVQGTARTLLVPGGPAARIADPAAPVRVELAVRRQTWRGPLGVAARAAPAERAGRRGRAGREVAGGEVAGGEVAGGEVAGGEVAVPLADQAFLRLTRQSSVAAGAEGAGAGAPGPELAPWMAATAAEAAPWWEIDLGRAVCLHEIEVELASAPPAGTRLVCYALGFGTPQGGVGPELPVLDAPAATAVGAPVRIAGPRVARYVRVALVPPPGRVAQLAVAQLVALGSELCADRLRATLERAFAVFGARPLVLARAGAGYVPAATYAEVWELGAALARGLAARLEPAAGRVILGVMLRSRPEWIACELAALARGYLVVALSPDEPDEPLAVALARARPACVICEATAAPRVRRLAPGVRALVAVGGAAEGAIAFEAVVAEGAAAPAAAAPAPSEDADYAVLFTSGSTGAPKGAVRTYRTVHAMLASYALAHSPRHLSFQPLSHLSERMYLPALLVHGGEVAFSRGGAHVLEELRALEPTTVSAVPRLYEVLAAAHHRRVARAVAAAGPAASAEAARAAATAASLAEARAALGPRLRAVAVGSAPVSAEVLAFLRAAFADVWVSEGYGATELGSIAFDGKVLDHVEVKLVPVPGRAPREPVAAGGAEGAGGELAEVGEIWVRTPHAIAGYLGDPEATAAAIDDAGYFATGDLGARGADGRVRVIGRLRNTVKLAQGELVSIERVEAALASAPVVDRVLVHAAHGGPGLAAVVVPHGDALAALTGASAGEPLAALVARPGAAAAVAAALAAHGRGAGLAAHELPRAVLLDAAPFTVEAGLLTASGKLARAGLTARYGAALAAAAEEAARAAAGEDAARAAAGGEADPSDELLARVVSAASRVAGRRVDPREPLAAGLGVDSLAVAELLDAIGCELGRAVPLAEWFAAPDLAALAARLAARGDAVAAGAVRAAAEADRALGDRLAARRVRRGPRGQVRRVLITGATGLLGAHLVERFAARGAEVIAVVRAPDDVAAQARLARALGERGIAAPARLRAVAADLALAAEPGSAARGAIAAAIAAADVVVHAAAAVSWLASYPALRAVNVLGALAVLEAAVERGVPLHHVSTISAAPIGGDEDSRLELSAAIAGTPYALSKWIAEEHARRGAALGAPVAIHRPAMIAPHTVRGLGNRDDFPARYLAGCLELGRYIDEEGGVLDLTPVDFVADAIAALAVAHPRAAAVYHLANTDQSLSYAALGRALAAAGARVAPTPYAEFRAALLAAPASPLRALAAFFPERFSLGMGPVPCQRTDAALAALGVRRPRIDDAYVARVLAALRASGAAR
jgi:fatty acid CoA ligase FadD9